MLIRYVYTSHIEIETFSCRREHHPEICVDIGGPYSVIRMHQLGRIMKVHDQSRLAGIASIRVFAIRRYI